jgi:shikimate dehydrogenase
MQNAAFRAAAVDGIYVALRAHPEGIADLVRGLAYAGGGGNVTLPHKAAVLAGADRATPEARRTGVANTFWSAAGQVWADNTDVAGFARSLEGFRPGGATDLRVLVAGAGGAAQSVVAALVDGGAVSVDILNRTYPRARDLAAYWSHAPVTALPDPSALRDAAYDLVVNATRLGLNPDDPPAVDLDALGRAGAVFDVVYGADGTGTPLTRAAEQRGIPARDGLEMLVYQGAAAFERWWDRPAPIEAMRAALARAPVG